MSRRYVKVECLAEEVFRRKAADGDVFVHAGRTLVQAASSTLNSTEKYSAKHQKMYYHHLAPHIHIYCSHFIINCRFKFAVLTIFTNNC